MYSMMPGQMSPQLLAMLQAQQQGGMAQGGAGMGMPGGMGGGMMPPAGAGASGAAGGAAPLQGIVQPQQQGGGARMPSMGGALPGPMNLNSGAPGQPTMGQAMQGVGGSAGQTVNGQQTGASGLQGFAQLLKALSGGQSGTQPINPNNLNDPGQMQSGMMTPQALQALWGTGNGQYLP